MLVWNVLIAFWPKLDQKITKWKGNWKENKLKSKYLQILILLQMPYLTQMQSILCGVWSCLVQVYLMQGPVHLLLRQMYMQVHQWCPKILLVSPFPWVKSLVKSSSEKSQEKSTSKIFTNWLIMYFYCSWWEWCRRRVHWWWGRRWSWPVQCVWWSPLGYRWDSWHYWCLGSTTLYSGGTQPSCLKGKWKGPKSSSITGKWNVLSPVPP